MRFPRLVSLSSAGSLLLCLMFGGGGCEGEHTKAPPPPKSRNDAVQAKRATPGDAPSAAPAGPVPSATRAGPRLLCPGSMSQPAREVKPGKFERVAAPGEASLPEQVPFGHGWIWVNFWAGWCVPCKEEIPRLVSFERRLKAAGKDFALVFVSLDDDERQLRDFLRGQPPTGLRRSYWLRDPDERQKWLTSVGVGADPQLPAHLLVDPKGNARCVIGGAVEDGDYDQVAALLSP